MTLVGKKAPDFSTAAVVGGNKIEKSFSLRRYRDKQAVLFFFYPKDFTPVCHSETLAFQKRLADFEKLGAAVVGASIDTEETHLAWLNTPVDKGGIQGVTYPIVADTAKTIAYNYGVLAGEWEHDDEGILSFVDGPPIAYRGIFLIDKAGIVRHELVNDFMFGRDVEECLRIVAALQHYEKHGDLCLANWKSAAS